MSSACSIYQGKVTIQLIFSVVLFACLVWAAHGSALKHLAGVSSSIPDTFFEKALDSLSHAKQQYVGDVRALLSVQGSVNLPNSGVPLEQFTTTVLDFVNKLANGTLIHPIRSARGFHIPNLDSEGVPLHLPVEVPSSDCC